MDFDIGQEPTRNTGWICLWLVAGALIALQLIGYFTRTPNEKPFAQYDAVLRRTMTLAEGQRQLPGGAPDMAQETAQVSYEDPIAALVEARKTSTEAARLYVAMRQELGQQATPEDVQILLKSQEKADVAFAHIYSAPELRPDTANLLIQDLPKDGDFVWRAARIHAKERSKQADARKEITSTEAMGMLFAITGAGAFGCVGFMLWGLYIGLRSAGRLKPLGHPSGALTPADADRYAMRVAVVLAISPLIGALTSLANLEGAQSALVAQCLTLAALIFVLVRPMYGKRISFRLLGLHADDLGRNILWGVAAAAVLLPMVAALAVLSNQLFRFLPEASHPVTQELLGGANLTTTLIFLLVAAVFAPIIEEITFRAHLFPALTSVFNSPAIAAWAGGLVFAALHPTGIPAWLPLAGIGALASWLTFQTRSLVPAIVMHAIHNAITIALASVAL